MVQRLAIAIPNVGMSDANSLESTPSPLSIVHETSTFAAIPLTALSKNTRHKLSNLLNSRKILRSEEGYERDWRGIAALSQQRNCCDENALSGNDPMNKVLHLWCSNNPKTATFAHLERFLGIIDRWDVSDDICENLVEDAKNYTSKLHQKSLSLTEEPDTAHITDMKDDFGLGTDSNILTKDDVLRAQKGLPPQKYDAFVLFADADINYAVEMLTKLEEGPQYNFKLCIKDRDLLAGISFAHVALTQLIEERCKHLIVILTEEFLKSPENKFLVNYTQALQIQNKTRKIIPLLYEDAVDIPRTLKIYTHLKYNASAGTLFNFWGKLAASIRNVNISTEASTSYTNGVYSSTVPRRQKDIIAPQPSSLANLPTPPSEIPSININGNVFIPADDIPKKIERNKYKKHSSLRRNFNHSISAPTENLVLRNAHSTSQLNAVHAVWYDTNASISNLSTASGNSDTLKKKKKWPSKLFKKVFSRSSTKLQEPA